jgi:hypothetical protein
MSYPMPARGCAGRQRARSRRVGMTPYFPPYVLTVVLMVNEVADRFVAQPTPGCSGDTAADGALVL